MICSRRVDEVHRHRYTEFGVDTVGLRPQVTRRHEYSTRCCRRHGWWSQSTVVMALGSIKPVPRCVIGRLFGRIYCAKHSILPTEATPHQRKRVCRDSASKRSVHDVLMESRSVMEKARTYRVTCNTENTVKTKGITTRWSLLVR